MVQKVMAVQDNATKFFATSTVKELCEDVRWLSRATDTIMQHWRMKNARRTTSEHEFTASPDSENSEPAAMPRG